MYHSELSRDGPGLLLRDILSEEDAQIEAALRVLRDVDADVLVLADFDYDLNGVALGAFADRLGSYPHRLALPSNRGRPSGVDLDGDGKTGGAGDAVGFAAFRGQGALAVLSRLPLDQDRARDFNSLAWTSLPENLALAETPPDFPLSTTSHWDIPLVLGGGRDLRLLTWHATPPVFDGPEDRNGRRNHDESAFWSAYLDGKLGLRPPTTFVLAGVANLDPLDGDGRPAALQALLTREDIHQITPKSEGGARAAERDGAINSRHRGDPAHDTVDWPDGQSRPGNLRVDYLLPSANLTVIEAGVFWPRAETSLGRDVERASRHRLVWVDLVLPDGAGNGG